MTTEQLIGNYSPVGDIISIVTCVILLFVIERALYFLKDKKFVYLESALHYIFVGACANLGFCFVVDQYSSDIWLIFLTRDIYHVSFMMCLYCFILYMKKMLSIKGKLVTAFTYITRLCFGVCVLLDVLSPFTKIGFHVENDGTWHDAMVSPYNFYYAYMVVLFLFTLMFNAKRLIRSVRNCLIITWIVVAFIMWYQAVQNMNSYTSFTYVLPVLVVMILLHSKPYDDKTGALSLSSFESFVKESVRKGTKVDYIALKFNTNMFDHMPKELGKALNSFWFNVYKNVIMFNVTSDLFIFAIPEDVKNGDTKEKFKNLVENSFPEYYEEYKLAYRLIGMFGIDFADNASDIMGIIMFLSKDMEDNTCYMVDDRKKKELKLYKLIRKELEDIESKGDLDDPRVLAYCQPIRNMKTGKFDTAEALMRLQLPEEGMVMPYMFIPLAEDYNYIHMLTKIMLNKVCKQIKELYAEGYHLKRISVNFTASELRAEDFCDELFGILKEYDVKPSKVGVELTESQSDSDFNLVQEKLTILRNAGMTVYLDDIGTGYSNLDRIVKYNVDVVKFDRFFLLEAEKSVKIAKMLTQLSEAFSDLGYKLLYEGVETEEHENLCLECGADYIQGFKYSKPIPIEEFKDFLGDKGKFDENTINEIKSKSLINQTWNDFTYEEMKDHYNVLLTLSQLFYSMHIIDLIDNTAQPYNPTGDIKVTDVVNSSIGADEMMRTVMRLCTEDKDVDAILEFSDLNTIAERMKGRKMLESDVYLGKSIGPYVSTFYTIEVDEESRPTKLLYTTRSVER